MSCLRRLPLRRHAGSAWRVPRSSGRPAAGGGTASCSTRTKCQKPCCSRRSCTHVCSTTSPRSTQGRYSLRSGREQRGGAAAASAKSGHTGGSRSAVPVPAVSLLCRGADQVVE